MRILIVFLLATTFCISQNVEPFQRQFMYYGTPQYLSSSHDSLKLTKFQLGWHWGDEPMITKTLLMNQCDIDSKSNPTTIPPNTLLFIRSRIDSNGVKGEINTHCAFDKNLAFGKSLSYDPTLFINPNNVYELNIRDGDNQNPIFGFLNKRGRVLTDPQDENYSRLIIDGDSLINEVVLKDPWPSRMMYFVL